MIDVIDVPTPASALGTRLGTRDATAADPDSGGLVDAFGRRVEYLRVSLTDRCNYRCVYCMPAAGLPWLGRADILTDDEIIEVVRQLAALGLRRVRLTGGEPTLRPTLVALVGRLRALGVLDDLSLSTNGVRLAAQAAALRAAGLDRVNVSVDSLDPARSARIARRDLGFDPLAALAAAEAAGLAPIKVNFVVMRGVNDDELEQLAALTVERPWHVRFIELMPVGELAELLAADGASPDALVVPSDELLARLAAHGARLGRPLVATAGPRRGNGPAAYHRFAGAAGSVGVITPMTHTYCGSCNRVRLTADGRLRPCLYGDGEVELRTALRAGQPLAPLVHQALAAKPQEHALLSRRVGGLRALSQIGG